MRDATKLRLTDIVYLLLRFVFIYASKLLVTSNQVFRDFIKCHIFLLLALFVIHATNICVLEGGDIFMIN